LLLCRHDSSISSTRDRHHMNYDLIKIRGGNIIFMALD
jgi:hypothetical protein